VTASLDQSDIDVIVRCVVAELRSEETAGIEMLSVQKVSESLGGVSRKTIYGWIDRGDLPCVDFGGRKMVLVSDLREFVESRRRA
jgi:excisionase family DNA binding protein